MIDFVRGVLAIKSPTSVTVDVGGVGYAASITLQTFDRLPDVGAECLLLTHLHVREDAMQLFGFIDDSERRMFRELLTISGIGARMAVAILSGCGAAQLRAHVGSGNVAALTRIPGVGKKTAERLIVELRDRVAKLGIPSAEDMDSGRDSVREEALLALIALGYPRNVADKAVDSAVLAGEGKDASVSVVIRHALSQLAG